MCCASCGVELHSRQMSISLFILFRWSGSPCLFEVRDGDGRLHNTVFGLYPAIIPSTGLCEFAKLSRCESAVLLPVCKKTKDHSYIQFKKKTPNYSHNGWN